MKIKTVLFMLALTCFVTTTTQADPGDFLFGNQDNPQLILKTSDDGYGAFAQAVEANTNGTSVNWEGVVNAISNIPSLQSVHDFFYDHPGASVYVECCGIGNGYSCSVAVPLSCSQCPCIN